MVWALLLRDCRAMRRYAVCAMNHDRMRAAAGSAALLDAGLADSQEPQGLSRNYCETVALQHATS